MEDGMQSGRLKDKVALVTGASRGIGRAIAEKLAADGADVVVNYRSREKEALAVRETIVRAGRRAILHRADVAVPGEVDGLFDRCLEQFGKLDILVNNAGIRVSQRVEDVGESELDGLFGINFKGTFFCCRRAARCLADGGRIVSISTTVTRMMMPEYALYAASKAAVDQLTRVLASELGSRAITVNAVSPGPVDTELFRAGKSEAQISRLAQMAALGRIGRVDDIAEVVAFLVSEQARWISGQSIHVNGGMA
jgi:3-oxoacyl-[acyl-carrier protein] reductase